MFSGIGGFELGIQQAHENLNAIRTKNEGSPDDNGHLSDNPGVMLQTGRFSPTCIGYSEIDKYAIQIYERHFNHQNYGDCTTINASELPDFDLLVGGFPCQAFSIAGKRKGFDDTRGTLFFDIARIAKAKKPLHMLLENVKGLMSHDDGKTLEIILLALQELGYYVNIEIYNSKDFGVPQNRERIIFQCHSIRLLDGVSQMTSFSKNIIEQYLFQLLLNNLKEVQKLQETASKDWAVGWLLSQEISRNLKSNEENTSVGISMATADELFQSKDEDQWQNIAILLSNSLGEDLNELNTSTISTAISKIIESETYTYLQMQQAIWLAIVLLRQSSSHLWSEVLSNLIVIKEDTKYARINDKTEEVLITEYGVAHKPDHFQTLQQHFIIGHLGRCCGRQVFPLGGDDSETSNLKYVGAIMSEQNKQWLEDGKLLSRNFPQGQRVYATDGISATLASQAGGLGAKTGLYAIPVLTPDRLEKRQNGRRFKENGEPSFTLTSQDKHGIYDGMRIRRLTPTECERLQAYPDGWTEGVSDTQRYKCLGNAVTVNVIKEIITRLYENLLGLR